MPSDLRTQLLDAYARLEQHFGHEPHWWPIITDDPPFEILVGAVLVQQTRWQTVEAAVYRLRDAGLMRPAAMAAADTAELAAMIRPCAFHTQKAPGLQAICRHLLERHGGDVRHMLDGERRAVRAELLSLPRIGRESADTVMLYAGGHPAFIVDAYARRVLGRLGIVANAERAPYDAIQAIVEDALVPNDDVRMMKEEGAPQALDSAASSDEPVYVLPHPSELFWRLHALIVEICIHHCHATRMRHDAPGARPRFVDPRKCAEHCVGCSGCPLRDVCATYQATRG